ncbi:glutamate ABC transporter substrate-binding protein [Corynebacterium sp. TAE3-ERU16]|uniref:glutamate ABC transporter substrate-binding protein n=1 Tax=Corynebacterium sp. TAE3-ERU16 TaxID=2849493 RepID=UPI001C488DF4|nr:glutamate ABC transporter substrate-binding protein [Corynebacterium sp. TAE3-ERU16]MBV7293267.1 glutamate ABC transporter substrate-binding protein [Corynebacterium sp. TAE3-ERU16]
MNKFIRNTLAITAAGAMALSLAACGDSNDSDSAGLLGAIESGKVNVGTKFDQPGLGLRTPDGTFTGLDVDVATYVVNHIAEENNWNTPEITWKETPSAQRETMIKNGEVDMIAATYSINASRAEAVNFAGPYLITHQALLVRKDDDKISSLEDLDRGGKLCSVSGSTPAQKVKDALPGVQLQEYDTYASCVEALSQGKVDAVSTDATILYGYASQYDGQFSVIEMVKPDGEAFTDEYYGIGMMKDDAAATDAVNEALSEMYSSGEFIKFLNKNLGDDASVVEEGTPGDLSFLTAK